MGTKYWIISNAGESHEPATDGYRCVIEDFGEDPPHRLEWAHLSAIWRGEFVENWTDSLVVRSEEPGPLEDMPWAAMDVISNRLRALLETHAPACAQFLPITLLHHDGTPATER